MPIWPSLNPCTRSLSAPWVQVVRGRAIGRGGGRSTADLLNTVAPAA
jgi:hypothetical protein